MHVVAGRTLSLVGSLGKLAFVRIGLVTIHALRECQRFLEVAVGVTLRAVHRDVLAEQRELGFRVVEAVVHGLQRNLLPPHRAVTCLAGLRKAAAVRILVTICALIEGDSNILRLAVGSVGVALRALHCSMQARQGITRLCMIELSDADVFPVLEIVARLARRAEPAFVLIFMAGNAGVRQSEVAAV